MRKAKIGSVVEVVVMILTMASRRCGVMALAVPPTVLPGFQWHECNVTNHLIRVLNVNVSYPLLIPGEVRVSVDVNITGDVPKEALLSVQVGDSSTFFGDDYTREIPCIENEGSCAYNLCDLLQLDETSSAVRKQLITELRAAGLSQCPLNQRRITFTNSIIRIPPMFGDILDTVVASNNFFITAKVLAGQNLDSVLGCVELSTYVFKPCLGWLCPKGLTTAPSPKP